MPSAVRWLTVLIVVAVIALVASGAFAPALAEPLKPSEVPEPLRPWIDWVLRGHEDAVCPFLPAGDPRPRSSPGEGGEDQAPQAMAAEPRSEEAASGHRACVWPARLELTIDDHGGRFAQDWLVHRDDWVPLPGDVRFWPQEVSVDGRAKVVELREGQPGVDLDAGRHRITGRFEWESLPPLLRVPAATGLLALTVRGREVPFPVRDAAGGVWLQKQGGPEEESRVDLAVHRFVDDDVPLIMTTRLEMRVSGRSREVLFGRVLPDGFVPMQLAGPLPARLDPAGRLLVQVRPGSWVLTIAARHTGPVSALARPDAGGPWAEDEVWVFQARPALRQVALSGLAAIDPQQTTLPADWRSLPAYIMKSGDTLRIEEKQRGDADPAPDQLTIDRRLWLDFNGGGWTIRDHIGGSFVRSWRLEMPAPAILGRVSIDAVDQVITRRAVDAPPGFEIRQGQASVEADSRIPGRARSFPALGWNADFTRASGRIHLPPGWRLLHATGVDDIDATWVSAWTLLDLFLVLILTLASARLWGRRYGLLTFAALGLSWIEVGAPRWTWVAAVVAAALVAALPEGRVWRVARVLHMAAIVVLVLVLVPFLVQQARTALYPALERPMVWWSQVGSGGIGETRLDEFGNAGDVLDMAGDMEMLAKRSSDYSQASAPPPVEQKGGFLSSNLAPDPRMVAQTGPGLSDWSWRRIDLAWRGPVGRGQPLRLFLLPPIACALLCWARVGLLTALTIVLILAGLRRRLVPGAPGAPLGAAAIAMVLGGLFVLAPAPASAAEFPPGEMLESLRERLLEPPDCGAACLSCPRLALEATPSTLRLRIEIDAAAAAAAPLPGGADMWMPTRVLLDGTPAPGLLRAGDGRLWIALTPGRHQVLMEGPLGDRDSVPLPLPLPPGLVTARADGWRVDGLQEGRAEETLQLARLRGHGDRGTTLEPGTMPPFVRVERALEIGLRWEIRTHVTRLTPAGTAVLIEVPLLPGEAVTSADVRVREGRAVVGLSPEAAEFQWTSVLDVAGSIHLKAPGGIPWTEIWRLAASPVWHVDAEGLAPMHPGDTAALRTLEWRPWPGESLTLRVTRPAPVDGRTLTIDGSTLVLAPGLRMADATLDLRLRASRGGEHSITLPAGAMLLSVTIDGTTQPIRQDGDHVILPLTPGRHAMQIAWREARGIGALMRIPTIDLGAESVNARVTVRMPADRWTLFAGGPRLGPAVLFWSNLIIALLVSFGLAATGLTPLRWRHWFLLSLGLTQVPLWSTLVIAGWLLVLGLRRTRPPAHSGAFDGLQILITAWTLAAAVLLFWAIEHGLLGLPDMQVTGNGSTSGTLEWYLDRSDGTLPRPWVLSVPLLVYRVAMLAWALWLAAAMVRWLRWGWECFNTGGIWSSLRRPRRDGGATPPPDGGSPGGGSPPVIGPVPAAPGVASRGGTN